MSYDLCTLMANQDPGRGWWRIEQKEEAETPNRAQLVRLLGKCRVPPEWKAKYAERYPRLPSPLDQLRDLEEDR